MRKDLEEQLFMVSVPEERRTAEDYKAYGRDVPANLISTEKLSDADISAIADSVIKKLSQPTPEPTPEPIPGE